MTDKSRMIGQAAQLFAVSAAVIDAWAVGHVRAPALARAAHHARQAAACLFLAAAEELAPMRRSEDLSKAAQKGLVAWFEELLRDPAEQARMDRITNEAREKEGQ